MKRKVRQLAYYLWDGLWFIPGLLAMTGLLLGLLLSGFLKLEFFGLFRNEKPDFDVDLVVSVLVGLAGGLITVAGVVFSMTMVTLSSTSQQLGPRLLGDFLRRLTTKLAVGGFLAAFLFQVLIALGLAMKQPVSGLVVMVSVFISLFTFCLLLVFIHLVARFIQVPFLITDVAGKFEAALDDFSRMGLRPSALGEPLLKSEEKSHRIFANKTGYLQTIEAQELQKLAVEHDWLIQFLKKAGDFVAEGDAIALVYGVKGDAETCKRINVLVAVGAERTAQQDVGFALHHLVEIATKALSPGINDPWTAISVIDRIEGVLAPRAAEPFPAGLWYDSDEVLRLAIPVPQVADILGVAYNSIRQFGYRLPTVGIALVKSYRRYASRELHPDFAIALRYHLKFLSEDVERGDWNSADRQRFENYAEQVLQALQKSLPEATQL